MRHVNATADGGSPGTKESTARDAMTRHPYQNLTDSAFWKTGEPDPASPDRWVELVQSKQMIQPGARIATAGSCLPSTWPPPAAQHNQPAGLRAATSGLAADQHHRFGYSLYSARYGNIYTVRQLRGWWKRWPDCTNRGHLWRHGDHWIDGLRPSVEPVGLGTAQEVWSTAASISSAWPRCSSSWIGWWSPWG